MFERSVLSLSLSLAFTLTGVALATAPAAGVHQAPSLNMEVPEVLFPGELATIVVRHATPGAILALISSDGVPAPGDCPSALGGTCLDITPGVRGYRLESRVQADAQGVAIWSIRPSSALVTGARIALQAIEVDSGAVSSPWVGAAGLPDACLDDDREGYDVIAEPELMVSGEANDLVACPGDADTFAIRVGPGEFVRFGALFDHFGDGDVELSLYDPAGALLDASRTDDDFELVSWRNDQGTDAWVIAHALMVADHGGAPGVDYEISVDKGQPEACVPDAFEPDDRPLEGVHPPSGQAQERTACDADLDWLAYEVQAGEALRIEVMTDPVEGSVEARLHDPGGREVQRVTSDAQGRLKIEAWSPEQGTFRLSIRPVEHAADVSGLTYRVRADRFAPEVCPTDGIEAVPGQPWTMLPLGASFDLGVCNDARFDLFAVDLLAGERLDVAASFEHRDGDIDLYLVDVLPTTATGLIGQSLARSVTTSDQERLLFRAQADGRYFVVVRLTADGDDTTWNGAAYDLLAEIR